MRNFVCTIAAATVLSASTVTAFVPSSLTCSTPPTSTSTSTQRQALWRNWIPELEDGWLERSQQVQESRGRWPRQQQQQQRQHKQQERERNIEVDATNVFLGSLLTATLLMVPATGAQAVSGGGLDYAGLDISGQDYSKNSYKGKDFTQVIAKGTSFVGSNLQGCRFYKSYLVNADFEGADITGASLEDTSMDGANLKNTVAKGSYFSKSLLDVATVENADFSDAQFPPKVLPLLCERSDMKGTNPTTGADTRDSAMCP